MQKAVKRVLKKIFRETISELLDENHKLNELKIASNLFNDPSKIGISRKAIVYPPFQLFESKIGDYSYVAKNSRISNSEIGKFCSMGANLVCGWGIHPTDGISTSPMFYSTNKQNGFSLSLKDKIKETRPIRIGNDVFVGMNVTILDGVTIGDGAVIGAGAVVSKNIPPYAVAVGNPIRILRYRFTMKQIELFLKIKWWDWEDGKLAEIEAMFFNVDEFLNKYGGS